MLRSVVAMALTVALGGCDRGATAASSAEPAGGVPASARPDVTASPPILYGDRFAPPPEAVRRAVAVAVGDATSCAVLANGTVWCWGSDAEGELGWDMPMTFNEPGRVVPTRVHGVEGATAVAVARGQGCAIVAEGALRCWGATGEERRQVLPTRVLAREVAGLRGVAHVALGGGVGCAVLGDGTLQCWDGPAGAVTPPTLVRGVTAVEVVLPSWGGHACLLGRDGAVQCGLLDRARLSTGAPFGVLGSMRGGQGARDLALHGRDLCAVRGGGQVICWELDARRDVATLDPEERSGPSDVVEVTGDCTRTSAGAVRCKRPRGEDPGVTLTGVEQLAAGDHACALDARGSIQCWGSNSWGQLANGTHRDAGPAPILW